MVEYSVLADSLEAVNFSVEVAFCEGFVANLDLWAALVILLFEEHVFVFASFLVHVMMDVEARFSTLTHLKIDEWKTLGCIIGENNVLSIEFDFCDGALRGLRNAEGILVGYLIIATKFWHIWVCASVGPSAIWVCLVDGLLDGEVSISFVSFGTNLVSVNDW